MVVVKMCANCYYGTVHHGVGMVTYVKCMNEQNKHPEKAKAPKHKDGMVLPALLDLECWEPQKD